MRESIHALRCDFLFLQDTQSEWTRSSVGRGTETPGIDIVVLRGDIILSRYRECVEDTRSQSSHNGLCIIHLTHQHSLSTTSSSV
ncbi:hypothetical protein GBAR_LOCUS5719 [Geodia barretti]|uniref:Uncharacterized protein n=1 Tax=Geodia barretti TaxID=519541 RepID=A0AA35RCS7_GEOBA|nr:hypothetical protein GBAR_LOCUS5719 [Geodia barretti]